MEGVRLHSVQVTGEQMGDCRVLDEEPSPEAQNPHPKGQGKVWESSSTVQSASRMTLTAMRTLTVCPQQSRRPRKTLVWKKQYKIRPPN